ncbi:N-acetylmuramoyl-L-alanine amidase [Staphylococcus epidermidis]|uniref:N-acetylmuramoyl-L-alanine amidase n=1 Tax=Staphylococcus epidermidis TaxID=1282 RepID=UPI0018A7A34F|nr:N-acetylmuramoyl-L-alanine amidase [Staphylococcus epidermidis]MBF8037637.1 N-acetylmuramoyl-L-alanine amidase [Staphylococcus epidermidis]MBF8059708.1 N-acetylmuramoyl-L-alanine amidase [Staphylococcus epidermidis]MCG1093231.1 N-acetylmuramoyl-L-alanine amidase [Staphylococcus epidermidis]MCG1104511.1 N-acetylmuramoyl-L-alanine amidase [Staphylococcus epidermidis]MCG1106282.1 N-acetylmuramoyl-L-alanine amidase [Staphylococcus epidermidis]
MKKIDSWLTKHGLKNRLTLVVIVIFIIFLILLFMFVNLSDEDTGQFTITENAELRTGPNAAYPVIYKIEKGKSFKKIDRKGKWIEVQNHAGTEKGWVAGWHTNLNIPADQSLSSNPLKGKTIVLDPGHGGSDQGASSSTPSKSLEKNYTLKTAKELKKLLNKEGAHVKMTRSNDKYVSLDDRNIKGDAFISIHNDALDSSNANGVTVYWFKDKQESLAQTLNSAIQKKALLTNRGSRQQNYQVLRQTDIPAVLLELGYISNPTDESMINDQLHRQVVEQAIVDGLKQYFSS